MLYFGGGGGCGVLYALFQEKRGADAGGVEWGETGEKRKHNQQNITPLTEKRDISAVKRVILSVEHCIKEYYGLEDILKPIFQ